MGNKVEWGELPYRWSEKELVELIEKYLEFKGYKKILSENREKEKE